MENIFKIIKELENESSTNGKIEILKENKHNELLQKVLLYTYNTKKYGVSEKVLDTILSKNIIGECEYKDIFSLLNKLADSNINDNFRRQIGLFFNENKEHEELYKRIILKDIRCNISSKIINKVFPGLIPTSEGKENISCMLASKFDFDKELKEDVYLTEKIDGIRCNVILRDGEIELYTRQGKLITGCQFIEYGVGLLGLDNIILDGEIVAKDCSYEDIYKETIKRVKNKNQVKTGIELRIFDVIKLDEFDSKKAYITYENRRKFMDNLKENEYVKIVPVICKTKNKDEILDLLDKYRSLKAEGLMCNTNGVYEFKRSKNCQKIKVMQSADVRVIDVIEGTGKYVGMLGAVTVEFEHEGRIYTCNVGSGFDDKSRKLFWDNKELILNKIIECNYFEITKNDNGGYGLRFGIYKHLREDKTEISMH